MFHAKGFVMTSHIARPAWRQSYPVVLLGTLIVVAAADFFVYDNEHSLGWTSALVAAAMLMVLALRDTTFLGVTGGRVAWLATLGLLAALIEQPTWLNILYLLLCLATLALINAQGWDNSFTRWLARLVRWIATGWTRLFRDNGIVMRWLIRGGVSPALARGIAAWIIPVLFTSIFIAIFAWANPLISDFFDHLGTWISRLMEKLPEYLNPGRIFFWFIVAAFAWSLLRSRVSRRRKTAAVYPPPIVESTIVREDDNALGIPASMVIRCLVLFNLVFAIELALDLFVMLSAKYGTDGTAFKTYVRKGAYPLVAAALLAGAFVLVTFRRNSTSERSPWARRLVYLWIGQTILLTCSAVWRLVRYIDLTELTRLRVASTIWFILVALGLFYIIWRIVRGKSNGWLINVNAVTALALIYPWCFINTDSMIANFNARHCEEVGGGGSPLDIDYFESLGTPALPALDTVRDRLVGDARKQWAADVSNRLHEKLDADVNDWRAWTWRRARSKQKVEQIHLAKARAREQQLAQQQQKPPQPSKLTASVVPTAAARAAGPAVALEAPPH